MRTATLFSIVAAVMSSGCALGPATVTETDEQAITVAPELPPPVQVDPDAYPSDGELCIFANDPGFGPLATGDGEQTFEDGDRLVARVALPECLSQSCDIDRVAHCEVIRVGHTLIVSSVLEYTEKEEGPCTLDCGRLTATCESEPLDAGSYRVVHGDESVMLDVPSSTASCVFIDDERVSDMATTPECEEDADCTDGYCNGDGSCLAWAEVGAWCGGYAPGGYARRCAPELDCISDSPFPDFPGTCTSPM